MSTNSPSLTDVNNPAQTKGNQDLPHVLVVFLATGRPHRLVATLRTLRSQTYQNMDVIGVHEGKDREGYTVMSQRIGSDRLLHNDLPLGFAGAANDILTSPIVTQTGLNNAEILIFIRDDVALESNAIELMVKRLLSEDDIGVVGPKIRAWTQEPILRSYGSSTDAVGYPESGIEDGELDQGQHDDREASLWVSDSCFAIKKSLFQTLGGFDRRYGNEGADFDLCWRARIKGWRVVLEKDALVFEASQDEDLAHKHYLESRSSWSTLVKNTSFFRLLPLSLFGFISGFLSVIWLLLNRRFAHAFAVIRAGFWSLFNLGGTIVRRGAANFGRRVSEREIDNLRHRGIPRVRRIFATFFDYLNSDEEPNHDGEWSFLDPLSEQPFQRFLRDQSLILVGLPMLVALIFSSLKFWFEKDLIGGQFLPFVNGYGWLQDLTSHIPVGAMADIGASSPFAWILAVFSAINVGPAFIGQRIFIWAIPVVAWVSTMWFAKLFTKRTAPRVFAAAFVSSSPLLVGTLSAGMLGASVIIALLPAMVSAAYNMSQITKVAKAWRSASLFSLLAVVCVGVDPLAGLFFATCLIVFVFVRNILVSSVGNWLRLFFSVLASTLLVLPWFLNRLEQSDVDSSLLDVIAGVRVDSLGVPMTGGQDFSFLWAATGFPALASGVNFFANPIPRFDLQVILIFVSLMVAVVVLIVGAVTIGISKEPFIAVSMLLLGCLSALSVPVLQNIVLGDNAGWIPTYNAFWLVSAAVIIVIITKWTISEENGRTVVSSWGMVLSALLVCVIAYQGYGLAKSPWSAFYSENMFMPAFVTADNNEDGNVFRMLRLGRDESGALNWALTWADGTKIDSFGQVDSKQWVDAIDESLPKAVSQIGADSGTTLGLLGIRWLVLDGNDNALTTALSTQSWLEKVDTSSGVVYRVTTAQPLISASTALSALEPASGSSLQGADSDTQSVRPSIRKTGDGWKVSIPVEHGKFLALSLPNNRSWEAESDSGTLSRAALGADSLGRYVNIWRLPEGVSQVEIVAQVDYSLRFMMFLQGVVLLMLLSLMIRPPGRKSQREIKEETLPSFIADVANNTGPIPVYRAEGQGDR